MRHKDLNLGQDHLEEAQAAQIVNVAPQLNFDDINGVHPHNRLPSSQPEADFYVCSVCPVCMP